MTSSATSLSFGNVAVGTSATQSLTIKNTGSSSVTIKGINLSGSSDYSLLSSTGSCKNSALAGGASCTIGVSLKPAKVGAESSTVLSVSTTASNVLPNMKMSGTGVAATATQGKASALTCASASITGAATDSCTVTLSAAAASGGQAVSLSSNSTAVTVPASVTVAAGATTASFTATAAAVTAAQSATLTASSGGGSATYAIKLSATNSTVATLSVQSASVAFGTVALNTPSYQSVTLTSSGTAPLTISAGTLTGTGFSMSGISFPTTLSPGQTANLQIEFDPTVAGAATGSVTLTSNCSMGSHTIGLSGTGGTATTAYQVNLSWVAPSSSPVGVTGYNIYRSTGTGGSYQQVNSSANASTSYTDSTVAGSTSYSYYVESVDAAGDQSVPSNSYTVSVP